MRGFPYLGYGLAILSILNPCPSAADPITLRYEVAISSRYDAGTMLASPFAPQSFVFSVTFDDTVTAVWPETRAVTAHFDAQVPVFSGVPFFPGAGSVEGPVYGRVMQRWDLGSAMAPFQARLSSAFVSRYNSTGVDHISRGTEISLYSTLWGGDLEPASRSALLALLRDHPVSFHYHSYAWDGIAGRFLNESYQYSGPATLLSDAPSPTPEPASLLLSGFGLAVSAWASKRRRTSKS